MDHTLGGFLHRQLDQGMALAAASDLVDLVPLDPSPTPQRYIACFHCTGLMRTASGEIVTANQFAVGVTFPDDYLRRADPFQVLTWLTPGTFHPNISERAPLICVGRIPKGTSLVDLIYQVHEIITFNKANVLENDALNPDACAWARHNQHRLPVDTRPLKRRRVEFTVELLAGGQ